MARARTGNNQFSRLIIIIIALFVGVGLEIGRGFPARVQIPLESNFLFLDFIVFIV